MGIGAYLLPVVILTVAISVFVILWCMFKRQVSTAPFYLAIGHLCFALLLIADQFIQNNARENAIEVADDQGLISPNIESWMFFLGMFLFVLLVVFVFASVLRKK